MCYSAHVEFIRIQHKHHADGADKYARHQGRLNLTANASQTARSSNVWRCVEAIYSAMHHRTFIIFRHYVLLYIHVNSLSENVMKKLLKLFKKIYTQFVN